MNRLSEKVAFITGGARGMGRAIASKFAAEGADIVICDAPGPAIVPYELATAGDLEKTAEYIRGAGRRCLAGEVDVRDASALRSLAQEAVDEFGKIDILVTNAGICSMSPTLELSQEMWQDVIDINLTGTFNSAMAVLPHMVARKSGSIVITTSVNATEPLVGMPHYVAAKHGALGLMRSFALEFGGSGVRVNAIAPGVIGTAMSDNEAIRKMIFGRPDATFEDYLDASHNWTALRNTTALAPTAVADAAIWLVSDESQYVTGIEVTVDGGHMLLPGFNHSPVVDEDYHQLDYKSTALD